MAKKKLPKWATTVTPLSKTLALLMFILFPILGFYYGTYYQKELDVANIKQTIVYKSAPSQTCLPPSGTISCNTDNDCPVGYDCTQAGPIVYNAQPHKTCWEKGSAIPL